MIQLEDSKLVRMEPSGHAIRPKPDSRAALGCSDGVEALNAEGGVSLPAMEASASF